MSYQVALEHAGADVHAFKSFGSYQGDWWAHVTYEGKTGWVHGYFGSCSGCDAFEAEFDYDSHYHGVEYEGEYISTYDPEKWDASCAKCRELKQKMADFGRRYLDDILTNEEALAKASENLEWDTDAAEMVDFIQEATP